MARRKKKVGPTPFVKDVYKYKYKNVQLRARSNRNGPAGRLLGDISFIKATFGNPSDKSLLLPDIFLTAVNFSRHACYPITGKLGQNL